MNLAEIRAESRSGGIAQGNPGPAKGRYLYCLLTRMLNSLDGLCIERDRRIGEERRYYPGTNKVIRGAEGRR